jgi:hypothetical protein
MQFATPNSAMLCLTCFKINLVVGDYFKSRAEDLKYSERATKLSGWLRSKTFVLALLCQAQLQMAGHAKAIIQPVLTHWTAHYLAYHRLLELHPMLSSIIYQDQA